MSPVRSTQRAVLSAALVLSAPAALQAQAPDRIDACYVPISGTIYRRNTTASPAPGAPANCLTPAHVAFEIQNGSGTIGPDLIYSGKIDMGKSASFGGSILAKDVPVDPSFVPTGPGTRFMWIGQKAALRAGVVTGGQWDWASIGDRSIALGRNVSAPAMDGIALGANATAVNTGAVVISAGGAALTSFDVGSLTLGGESGIRLVTAGNPETNCTVRIDGVMDCSGGVRLGNSLVQGNGEVRMVPAGNSASHCTVQQNASLTCTGGVKLTNSMTRVLGPSTTVQAGYSQESRATCPAGYRLTGGGVQTAGGDIKVRQSYPETDRGWLANVRNDHPFNDGSMVAYALCVRE